MATLAEVPEEVVTNLRAKLKGPALTLPEKYRVLFSLRNVKNASANEAMLLALRDDSDLFRHEVAFCLGQKQDPQAIDTLKKLLADATAHPMVRHEAGEALGAIDTPDCWVPLRAHVTDACQEVRETCQLAVQRMEYQESSKTTPSSLRFDENPYNSVDPTPAMPKGTDTAALRALVLDENASIFDRYTAMFALRNKGGAEAVEALCAIFGCSSALLKHEVAYVLGQMQDARSVEVLTKVLRDAGEHAMVRHEAAEALGSIGSDTCLSLLRDHCKDPEPIVADSCIVALDMIEFEASGAFQYADTGAPADAGPPAVPCA